ncbi:MAG: GNAT family N-acetyltransferase [Verrucomicrobia bacterium]|nr:GNAT family N-acetyltransferase [Verrucomicrobiota bacterium]
MNLVPYEVEFLKRSTQIPNGLWDTCFHVPGEGRWWYEALDQSGIDDQFTFFYGLIKHLGCQVGIAPIFTMDVPVEQVAPHEFLRLLRLVGKIVPSVLYQRTLFVGSPVLDESRVGLISHVNRRAALLALQVALEKKAAEIRAPLIVWKDFPESSSADLNWLAQQRRLFRVISFPNTMVEFGSHRKEDYFAAMKGSRRRKLKTKLRRSRELVALSVEIIQRPDPKTLDDIFGLFWQTYEKSVSKFERLNRKFFEVVAEKQATHFIVLREEVSREMIAFMLCFDMGERLINMFIGIDYKRPKEWMLFFRLWEAAVDLALSRGFTAIVSGRSAYEAKIETGHKLVPLNNYCRHSNILLHTIYGIVAQRIDWASLDEALARFLKAHPGCTS